MAEKYNIAQGDGVTRIAYQTGFFWETIWHHPENAELKRLRKHGEYLNPGDVLFIPDKCPKEYSRPTDQRHSFRRKGLPVILRIRLLDEDDEPRADLPYCLKISGQLLSGQTDGEGWIRQPVPPDAAQGELVLPNGEHYTINIDHIGAMDSVGAAQAMLQNLAYYGGPIDNNMNDDTRLAIKLFQQRFGIPVTGDLDETTRRAIKDFHDG